MLLEGGGILLLTQTLQFLILILLKILTQFTMVEGFDDRKFLMRGNWV